MLKWIKNRLWRKKPKLHRTHIPSAKFKKFMKMMVYNEKKLSKVCKPVSADEGMRIGIILLEAAECFDKEHVMGCIGLAANQLGFDARVFVAQDRPGRWKLYINPVVVGTDRKVKKTEHCLSYPDNKEGFGVMRSRKAVVKSDNNPTKSLTGIWAEVVQHEQDHLNGVLV